MAQFDVHRNPGRSRHAFPYLVVVQSAWFDDVDSRLVAPLILEAAVAGIPKPPHMPRFVVEGHRVLLDPLQIQPLPRRLLGQPIASLAEGDAAAEIIGAIDRVITRAYG
jgi:toxin CcdB